MNVFIVLANTADRYGESGAIFVGEKQMESYAGLIDRARRLARGLSIRGAPGDRVLISSPNCPEYVEMLFAIWAAGQIAVPVNCKLHPREVLQIISDAEPHVAFVHCDAVAELSAAVDGKTGLEVIPIGGKVYSELLCSTPAAVEEVAPDDVAWLFYTSGTTGRSKGAMLTHRNLMAMTIAHLADFEDVNHNHSLIHAAPMSHASGLYVLPYVARGARNVIPLSSRLDADEILQLAEAHPGTAMFLAPTMVRRLQRSAEVTFGRPLNIRTILYGGAPMYRADLERAIGTFGQVFIQLYGQGEAPVTITGLRREDHNTNDPRVLTSVGWARSGVEVKVADARGLELPRGEIGEVICRGDVVMAGYWRNVEATREAIRDGWLWTGDMGSMDRSGLLTLRDRSKDVIISGGSNIYPREVEDVLLSHPSVREASVIGYEDTEWGEVVVAFVVLSADTTPQMLDEHCLSHLARYKRPKHYKFIEELPKNAYGKVLKRELLSVYKQR